MKTRNALLVLVTTLYVSNWWVYDIWKEPACLIAGVIGGIAFLASLIALTLSELG